MEKIVTFLLLAALTMGIIRVLTLPLKWAVKVGIHSGCGFLSLWLLNCVAGITGIAFPINGVTALTAGVLGLPGIGLLALLEML